MTGDSLIAQAHDAGATGGEGRGRGRRVCGAPDEARAPRKVKD